MAIKYAAFVFLIYALDMCYYGTMAKKKISAIYQNIHITILVEKDEDGFYVAECPVLEGCYSQGKTLDEALKNIREVIELQ